MKYRIITVLCLFALITVGIANTTEQITPDYITKANKFLQEQMIETNELTQKHYGFDIFHAIIYTKTGSIIMDLDGRGFNYSTLSKQAQVDVMVDAILMDRKALKRAGVTNISIFIDSVFFSEYDL